jgi:type II secretory pathway pseudopilin PulG
VVIAIIAILAALLLPALSRAKAMVSGQKQVVLWGTGTARRKSCWTYPS